MKKTNGERFSIKQLEKTKKSLEARLTKLLDSKKRDDVVTFEQLGVDRLFVDEAHFFKELCYRGSFGKGTLLYSATALFAVHSEDCDNKEKGDRVYGLCCRSIHAGIASQTKARQATIKYEMGNGVPLTKSPPFPNATPEGGTGLFYHAYNQPFKSVAQKHYERKKADETNKAGRRLHQ